MAIQDKKRVFDGFLSLEGGVDSGRTPVLLNQNQVSWAVNVSLRGGQPTTRPPWIRRVLDFDDLSSEQEAAFKDGLFQGEGDYLADDGTDYKVASISGRLFAINLTSGYKVQELTPYLGTIQTMLPWVAPAINANVVITLNSVTGLNIATVYAIDAASYELVSLSGIQATFKNINDPMGTANPAGAEVLLSGLPMPALNPNNPTARHVWFQQAENWLIVQDGTSNPFLWNGLTVTRSDPTKSQVPIGTAMAYGRGRLWVAQGYVYVGGDLVWSNAALGRDSVIYFTENTFLNEGGGFAVPVGPITGMSFAANLDTTLGDGDLLVFTSDDTYAFQAPIDRTVWANLQYPIQRFALMGTGSRNHESITRLNGDLLFRWEDGVGSFSYSRREQTTSWANTPMGAEVRRALEQDSEPLLYACSGENFDNRFLMTCSPRNAQDHGVWHAGVVVIDFDLNSNLSGNQSPVWEGVWTGPRVFQLTVHRVAGVKRLFSLALSDDDKIEMWELVKTGRFDYGWSGDNYDDANDIRIQSVIETRGMAAQLPGSLKQIQTTDMWFTRLAGELDVTGYYRNETSDQWNPIGTQNTCVEYRDCDPAVAPACQTPISFQEQGRSRLALNTPPDTQDVLNGGMDRDGYVFQVRLELEGSWRLAKFRVGFQVRDEDQYGSLEGAGCIAPEDDVCQTAECKTNEFCSVDDYSYLLP